MSFLNLTKGAAPSTPAASTCELYVDSADNRAKQIDENGVISQLAFNGVRAGNVIHNGGMRTLQRQVAAATQIPALSTTTRAGQVADRFAVTASVTTNCAFAQIDTAGTQDTALQSRYYGSIVSTTAGKKVMLSQVILSADMSPLRGKKVRVSIRHNQKVGTGQTYKLGLLQLTNAGTVDVMPAFLTGAWSTTSSVDPVWGTNLSPIAPDSSPTPESGTVNGNFVDCTTVATTWTKSSAVFTIPTSAKNLVFVFFSNATGGTTDNISFSEIMLTSGTEIQDYAEIPFGLELQNCQRFFCKSFPYAILPAASVTEANGGSGTCGLITKAAALALAVNMEIKFPVAMWKVPAITYYTPTAAGAQCFRYTGAAAAAQTATASRASSLTEKGVIVTATGDAAGVVGDLVGVHWSSEADFIL